MSRLAFVLFLSRFALAFAETGAPIRDPALSPDGRHLAIAVRGAIYVVDLESRESRPLSIRGTHQEHPSWSSDGDRLVFSALSEDRFRLFETSRDGSSISEIETESGPGLHAREPLLAGKSVVYVRQSMDGLRSDVIVLEGEAARVLAGHESRDRMPALSPGESRVAFVSDRSGDDEIWVVPLEGGESLRLTYHEGEDLFPSWSPDGSRIAYSTERGGERYLAVIDAAGGEPSVFHRGGGQAVWLPGGGAMMVAPIPSLPPVYNGNPFLPLDWPGVQELGFEESLGLARIPAPRPLEELSWIPVPELEGREARNLRSFDAVVETHRRLYDPAGDSRNRWEAQAERARPNALTADSVSELEAVVDELVAERPLIKSEGFSRRAVVASAHPLATEAGLAVLSRGGNVVDAAIAVSFMLGVVEPDASGIGGEGMMLVHLEDRGETVAVDFKDQVPMHATADNAAIFDGTRLKSHGPAAVNIPGVVAGMDLAYRKLGSGTISWAELIAPAIRAASDGVPVTPGLASSIAEGERFLKKYEAAAAIYLPGGKPLRPGELLVQADYARTLSAIAEEGASAFYQGDIAKAMARDMRANGGVLTEEDLAQY
ncbi:MAG: gamma-glutamyltransferase, partial [Vicinamibacteria bacterium]